MKSMEKRKLMSRVVRLMSIYSFILSKLIANFLSASKRSNFEMHWPWYLLYIWYFLLACFGWIVYIIMKAMIRRKWSLQKRCCVCICSFTQPRLNYIPRVPNFSTSRASLAYADTVPNLKIGHNTRVIFQGFTGKQVGLNLTPKKLKC